ncbi:MAG: signal peptidase I [Elusimicrobiota bacterium]|jgi:signal peptidase I
MEATLFWIGCGLGGYAYLLRKIFKKDSLMQQRVVVAGLHLFFLVVVGALAGFVLSASMEIHGPTPRFPVTGAVIGFLWAIVQLRRDTRKDGALGLLTGDLEWVETSFSAILLAAVIMYSVVQAFKIPSSSMEDTLLIGDHLFVNKFIYGIRIPFTDRRVLKLRDVRRGDIVVFEAPSTALQSREEREQHAHKDFIKRAIGLPGDEIRIKDKHVYINGQLQEESYAIYRDDSIWPNALKSMNADEYQREWASGEFSIFRRDQVGDTFGPVRVPPNCYFVMGDNRDGSFDSRFWGPMPNSNLKGKAWLVYWPIRRVKIIR